MKVKEPKPQYLINRAGKKEFVVLTIDQYNKLKEDLYDLSVMSERSKEPMLSLSKCEKRLKKEKSSHEGEKWSYLSLQSAMAGMEDENVPDYSLSDLKESA